MTVWILPGNKMFQIQRWNYPWKRSYSRHKYSDWLTNNRSVIVSKSNIVCARVRMYVYMCVSVSASWNKALTQKISKREFKLWTIDQGTEPREVTFYTDTCNISRDLMRKTLKSQLPIVVMSGSKAVS